MTTTTHITLRGPRGAIIMCKEPFAKAIDRAVFPGMQGGPHDHMTAGKAVAFQEALQPEFQVYAKNVIANAQAMAQELMDRGHRIITGGTDNHLMVVDMTAKGVSGKEAERILDEVGISTSRSTIPFDTRKPMDPSGVRLGTPAITTRGFDVADSKAVASCIDRAIELRNDKTALDSIRGEIRELCKKRPLYN